MNVILNEWIYEWMIEWIHGLMNTRMKHWNKWNKIN